MIRVAIFADTRARAQELADAIRSIGEWEIVEMREISRGGIFIPFHAVDVILADHVHAGERPLGGPPIVTIGDEVMAGVGLQSGVRASHPSDLTLIELNAALTAAAMEFTVLTEAQAKRWLRLTPAFEEERDSVGETLTDRELQVLRMLADGLGNKEIASGLAISEHTAKFHVAQILSKLAAGSRAKAVAIGIRRGLIPI